MYRRAPATDSGVWPSHAAQPKSRTASHMRRRLRLPTPFASIIARKAASASRRGTTLPR